MSHKERALKLRFLEWVEEILTGGELNLSDQSRLCAVDFDLVLKNIAALREQLTKELPPLTVDFFEDFKS